MPLSTAGATPEIECPKCDRRYSKPGWVEGIFEECRIDLITVQRVASQAFEWAAIESTKLAHLYPAQPTPLEWEALKVLAAARGEYEAEKLKPPPEKPKQKASGRDEWWDKSIQEIKKKQRG